MKSTINKLFFLLLFLASGSEAFSQKTGTTKYKCMVQMTNYTGEGAYVVISIINSKGEYDKTLYVMGDEKKWHPDMKEWHKSYKKKPTNISAITGASVSGGDRSVALVEIENSKIDAGYKLRFETAVEDKEYYVKDLEIPLTSEGLKARSEGTGYIRYVRFMPN
ncbi:DUF2271 domain-containing protein [Emticicia sp. CRIBPO]|uniref:DUF2271 domain-containing protein n=1 Tax=Emticicia sp. CRIBPO TaxID=2683258 RepID=UPI00141205C9|nr:DUF2271 domain-containing protein [Emticicia sp. CRIBPO]